MMEFGLLSLVLAVAVAAAMIWLVIIAFRQSVIWGLLVFLVLPFAIVPIGAIAFAIYHWDEAKKPFLAFMVIYISFMTMSLNTFHTLGGLEMVETTNRAITQLEKGEITEEEASRRVAEQAESSIKRMEEAGVIGTDERKLLQEKVQELKLDESDATASTTEKSPAATPPVTAAPVEPVPSNSASDTPAADAPQPAQEKAAVSPEKPAKEKLEYGPEWSLESALEKKREKYKKQQLDLPTPKVEGHYVPVPVSRAEKYIGQQVKVVKADTSHEGLLKAVNGNFITLDMQAPGGQVDFEIKRYQIQSLLLLTMPGAAPAVDNKKAGQ